MQVPPRFSAVKIDGERAYDLAREGEVVELAPRPVEINRLEAIETADPDHTVFAAECGKGTYVRALARDMGRALGCFGHVAALRRTAVGPFTEEVATSLETVQQTAQPPGNGAAIGRPVLLPVEAALAALPALRVSAADAGRLTRGQAVLLRGRDAPMHGGLGLGLRPRLAHRPGRGRERRIAPAAHLQSAAFLAANGPAAPETRNFRWRPLPICDIAPVARANARATYLWRPCWTTSRPGRQP